MKDYLIFMLKYNRDANIKMLQILEGMTEEERGAERKGYYKSLDALLDHIASSMIFWQKAIRSVYPYIACFSQIYYNTKYERGKISFPLYADLKKAIQTLDDNMIGIIEGMSHDDIEKSFSYRLPTTTLNISPSVIVFRLVNHGVHHRGQVSQILDELKIDNDFSRVQEKYE